MPTSKNNQTKELASQADSPVAPPPKPAKAEEVLRPLTPAQHRAIKAAEPKCSGKVLESLL